MSGQRSSHCTRRRRRGKPRGWVIALSLALAAWGLALALDGRDFAGQYDLTGIVEHEEDVSLTFSAGIANVGDVEVPAAIVRLEDELDPGIVYAEFLSVALLRGAKPTRLSSAVTVPRRAYEAWLDGVPPRLVVDYETPGGRVQRTVELVRMPLMEETP